ncbi:MAG TPA: hypothetical protein VJ385_20515 [Fibrobacteria bacterium]|nr:hypothetical protein [Fibrobacteria bacterium]
MPLLIAIVLFALLDAAGEDFSGEPYVLGSSVADNGTSGALPSRLYTATQFLDFPGDFGEANTFRLELASLPMFGDLSQTWDGALGYALDDKTHMSVFGQLVSTPDIPVLPLLRGSREDRLNDPGFRPEACDGCNQMRDMVYLVSLNFMRKYDTEFPRFDAFSRPIPIQLSAGVTAKYFYEELEGGDYIAQNMNLDAGVCMKFMWGFNPIDKSSDRNIKVQFSSFEILPTSQQSEFSGVQVYEKMDSRWRMSVSWEEGLPDLASTVSAGFSQKSEGGPYPGVGLEWDLKEMLLLRAGVDRDFISAGASVAWRWVSVHYAFRYHELGTSLYQVSGQVQWP